MGWMHESDTHFHEAGLVAFFEDGAESHGSTMIDGVDYEIVETGRHPDEDRRRPSAEIVGWVLSCDCASRSSSEVSTWTDPVQWTRVPSASLEDLARHHVFAPDTDLDVNVRPEVAAAAQAVWRREHLEPIDIDDEIRAAVDARRDADAQLDAAVAKARRLGRSWADIGAATGMTRQSANGRWKDRT
ncbi:MULTISPECIES: hypothetical protein [Gordonia]|uniref:hypothetical protein n=1 Tax=Gordonia TaxID=2053 RepID=UPI0008161805|nr:MULTISPECIES: hypothetical protein [Gordonia]UPG66492.1 hypothetical protein MVF96_13280 [Gordonia hongkongensis]SCC51259.1 hypothetical protein GA0061091_12158 [Gordonia sp. v-85]